MSSALSGVLCLLAVVLLPITAIRTALLAAGILTFFSLTSRAQQHDAISDKIADFPERFFSRINKKTDDLDKMLTRQTENYLNAFARKEAKLKKKLYKKDSTRASALYANDPQQKYAFLIQKLKTDSACVVRSMGAQYLPYADSLSSSLAFLDKNSQLLSSSKIINSDIRNSLSRVRQLQAKLQDADAIKAFIQQRKEQIRQCLLGYENPPRGATGILNSYNQKLYYYSTQIRQYRETLNDPDKMLRLALSILNKLPAFADFMKSNSFLAGLFSVPSNYGSADGLAGMQTRDQVLSLIQNQVGSGGAGAGAALQATLQTAQQDITNVQHKISSMGAGSGNLDMPNFKPQETKTQTFFQRLEYGTNLQTQHAAYFYPTTTDLGLSIGYKISDKNSVGLGGSYKIGWGQDIQHVSISSQGASLRSFFNVQARKSFYVSGGFEYNYQPVAGLVLNNLNSWQRSGLIGLSKIISMNTKVFKKTNIQLLWDFLSYYQVPVAQPVKFRVGYNF